VSYGILCTATSSPPTLVDTPGEGCPFLEGFSLYVESGHPSRRIVEQGLPLCEQSARQRLGDPAECTKRKQQERERSSNYCFFAKKSRITSQ